MFSKDVLRRSYAERFVTIYWQKSDFQVASEYLLWKQFKQIFLMISVLDKTPFGCFTTLLFLQLKGLTVFCNNVESKGGDWEMSAVPLAQKFLMQHTTVIIYIGMIASKFVL